MSRNDEPLTAGAVRMSATLTVARHRPGVGGRPGRCPLCAPEGCRQLAWAREQLARLDGARG